MGCVIFPVTAVMVANVRSGLISFVSRNGYLIKGAGSSKEGYETPELTHILMDGERGGKISIPNEAIDGFFSSYAEDLLTGSQLFVVEKRTTVFKFCIDVDFKIIYSEEDVTRFVTTACESVCPYFTDATGKFPEEASCIVCAVTNDGHAGGSRKAPGLHLIFPFAPVKENSARWIRSGVVHALRDLAGFQEDWNTVIDISVITTSGLRMVGSDKCRDCVVCKNGREARQYCSSCNRRGKLAENKVYWPWRVYPEKDPRMEKCLEQMKANIGHAARMCSIRLAPDVSESINFRVPPMAPGMAIKKRSKPGGDPDKGYLLTDEDPEFPKVKRSKIFNLNARTRALILETIHKYHPAYSRLEVKELIEQKLPRSANPIIWVKVVGFGSRFCLNKDGDHTSQNIYFVISSVSGLAQRCFSRKEVERRCGTCSNFTSNWRRIGAPLRAALFSDVTTSVASGAGVYSCSSNCPPARQNSSQASKIIQQSSHRTAELLAQVPPLPPRLARQQQQSLTTTPLLTQL